MILKRCNPTNSSSIHKDRRVIPSDCVPNTHNHKGTVGVGCVERRSCLFVHGVVVCVRTPVSMIRMAFCILWLLHILHSQQSTQSPIERKRDHHPSESGRLVQLSSSRAHTRYYKLSWCFLLPFIWKRADRTVLVPRSSIRTRETAERVYSSLVFLCIR